MGEFEDRVNSILGDPKQMEKIAGLAKSLMGGQTEPDEGAPSDGGSSAGGMGDAMRSLFGEGGVDSETVGRIGRILSASGAGDGDKRALLEAMKPYLSEKRRAKMDKAMKIARLARIAKLAMGELGEDKDV